MTKPRISTVEKDGKKRGRKPGCVKSGGRAKGTPNKKSIILHKILQESGVDIGLEIKKAFQVATPDGKIQLIKIVLEHFPKPVAIEVESEDKPKLKNLTNAEKAAKLASI